MQAGSQCVFPNGAILTPDGKTYIVAETFAGCLSAFDVAEDGSLSNKRVWADLKATFHRDYPGHPEHFMICPDGICLDAEGCVWVSVPAIDPTMTTEFIGGFGEHDRLPASCLPVFSLGCVPHAGGAALQCVSRKAAKSSTRLA